MTLKPWEESISDFNQSLSMKADSPSTLYCRGDCLATLGRFEEAIADFEKVLTLQPRAADAYMELGTIYKASDRREEAIEAYRRAIAIDPEKYPALEGIIEELEEAIAADSVTDA